MTIIRHNIVNNLFVHYYIKLTHCLHLTLQQISTKTQGDRVSRIAETTQPHPYTLKSPAPPLKLSLRQTARPQPVV